MALADEKVIPGSLGFAPASLKLKWSVSRTATWPIIVGLPSHLRMSRLSATGVSAAKRGGDRPSCVYCQRYVASSDSRNLKDAPSGRIASQVPNRLATLTGVAGNGPLTGRRLHLLRAFCQAGKQLGGQLIVGIEPYRFLELGRGPFDLSA